MKFFIITYLITLSSFTLPGQSNNTWTLFWNKDTSLIGFKDKNGVVKIKPKFKGFTIANKFDDIIAVTEEKNNTWVNYYLTKSGRKVGKYSMYLFDNGADCESEGYIRFRDKKTHMVGMFNKDGNIAIPAEYNDLTSVRNGLMIARKGAFWDEKKRSEIFQFPWIGGKDLLINTNNLIVIDNFNFSNNITTVQL